MRREGQSLAVESGELMTGNEQNQGRDLRIPNATPEAVGQALMRGGAAPRPETKLKKPLSHQRYRKSR